MELLLAIAVMAIVLVAINGVFFSALRLRNSVSNGLDESVPLEHAIAVMRRDLQNTTPPGGILQGGLQSGVVNGTVSQNSGITIYTTTGVLSESAPWGDVQKVSYQLQEPTGGARGAGKDLIRSVTRNLLPITTEEDDDQWLAGNIEQLQFDYFDGSNWNDTWDSSTGNTNLPVAVRVRIQVAQTSRAQTLSPQPIELIVPMVTQYRTNTTQSALSQ